MFEADLDLGKISVTVYPFSGVLPSVHRLADHTDRVKTALIQQGLENPDEYKLRGGFRTKKDLDLILGKGSDYHGRVRKSEPFEFSGVDSPHETFVASIDDIGNTDILNDPLWQALRFRNEIHALAVYDSRQLELARRYGHIKIYRFKHPRNKLKALLGILHLGFEA